MNAKNGRNAGQIVPALQLVQASKDAAAGAQQIKSGGHHNNNNLARGSRYDPNQAESARVPTSSNNAGMSHN